MGEAEPGRDAGSLGRHSRIQDPCCSSVRNSTETAAGLAPLGMWSMKETCKSSGVLAQPLCVFTVLDQSFSLSRPSHLEGGGGFALSVAKSDHLRDS